MLRRTFRGPSLSLVLLVLLGSTLLGGCEGFVDFFSDALSLNDEADAQDQDQNQVESDRRIETFTIAPNSLVILSDVQPTVEVQDSATIYTGVDGTITFTPTGESSRSLELFPTDTVIERPAAGTLTIDRDQ